MKTSAVRILADPAIQQAASTAAAEIAIANDWPIEKVDQAVVHVLARIGIEIEITETPERRQLLAPFRKPPTHVA